MPSNQDIAFIKTIVGEFIGRENECVNDLLKDVPKEGGSATRESFEQLVRIAFESGFVCGMEAAKANQNRN